MTSKGRLRARRQHLFLSLSLASCLAPGSALGQSEPSLKPVLASSEQSPAPEASLSREVDLRPQFQEWGLEPRRQEARPTCSAFTVAGALEYAAAKKQGHGSRFSVEFLNWASNDAIGDRQDGGFFSDLWKGYLAHGICRDEAMPYRPSFDPGQPPSSVASTEARSRLALRLQFNWIKEWDVTTGLTDEHVLAIKRTLHTGWPVCGGFRWPKREQWDGGVLRMCGADAVRDGHSVLLVGYRDDASQPGGGVFIFRNTTGEGRDGAMPYAYAQEYMNDAAWIGHQ